MHQRMKAWAPWIVLGVGVTLALAAYATIASNVAFEVVHSVRYRGAASSGAASVNPERVAEIRWGAAALVAGTAISVAALVGILVGWARRWLARRAKDGA